MKPSLIPAAIFAACMAAGWLAGQARQQAATDSQAAGDALPAKSRRAPAKFRVPSEVSECLARIRAIKNPEERLKATMQLAYTIPPGEIAKWYDSEWLDDGVQDMEAHLFYRVLRMRWMAADPQALMDYNLRKVSRNAPAIAAEWARKDPAAALAYLDGLKEPTRRARFAEGIGAAVAEADPRLLLSRIPDFQVAFSQGGSSFIAESIGKLAESAPDLLKAESAGWPDALRRQAEVALTGASLKSGFASGIASLAGTEKGRSMFMAAIGADSELMKEIAKQPGLLPAGWLSAALDQGGSYSLVDADPQRWLDGDLSGLGLTESELTQIRSNAISRLGYRDPAGLLERFSSGKLDPASRQTAIGTLSQSLPEEQREAFLATLTDEQDVALARQYTGPSEEQRNKGPLTSESLFANLAKEGGSVGWEMSRQIGTWGKEQIKSFASDFTALPQEQKAVVAGKLAASSYEGVPREIQVQMVDYLIKQPQTEQGAEEGSAEGGHFPVTPEDEKQPTRLAVQLAASWADENPGAASHWVTSLPAGEARLWAAKNVAARWADYEPQAAARWVATLPEAERTQVQEFMKSGGNQ